MNKWERNLTTQLAYNVYERTLYANFIFSACIKFYRFTEIIVVEKSMPKFLTMG